MSSAVSVAAVSASIRGGVPSATVAVPSASASKTSATTPAPAKVTSQSKEPGKLGAVQQPVAPRSPAPAPAASIVNPDLPLGLLLSVNRPPVANASASSDYVAMESALRTGNLTNAQQAYMRLQSDLQLEANTASATDASKPGANQNLDVKA